MTAVQLKSRLIALPISGWVMELSRGRKRRPVARTRSVMKVFLASRKPSP